MLTYEQYLLLKLAEEANEVAHMCMKTIQFGMDENRNGDFDTNRNRLDDEICDFFGVMRMLNEDCGCTFRESITNSKLKREKVEKYLEKSRSLGKVMPKIYDNNNNK